MTTNPGTPREREQQTTAMPGWMMDLAPGVMDFIRANHNSPFAKILSALVGFIFPDGRAEFPPVPGDVAEKISRPGQSERKIDPAHAAKAYLDAIGTPGKMAPDTIHVRYQGADKDTALTRTAFIEDGQTGFKGAVYTDQNGHSITFFGGMDTLTAIDFKDAATVAQGLLGRINSQSGPAQDLYLEAIRASKSTEIVGYSLGGMLANDMSARLNAKATTIADIGLPDVKNVDGTSMYTPQHIQNVRENVVTLKMPHDPYFAHAGAVYGKVTVLPNVPGSAVLAATKEKGLPANFNAQSGMAEHHPIAYYLASKAMIDGQESHHALSTDPIEARLKPGGSGTT